LKSRLGAGIFTLPIGYTSVLDGAADLHANSTTPYIGVFWANGRVGDGKVDALTYPAAYQARLPRSPTGVRLMIDTRPQVAGRD
jgi:hypothetical protein